MAELRGDLRLETDDAERSIERLAPLFDTIVNGFSVQLASALDQLTELPPPELDTSQIDAALASSTEAAAEQLALDLGSGAEEGAGQITDAISSAVDAADSTVEVDADTSAAEAALDDLAQAAQEVGGDVVDLGGAASGAGAAAGIATGSFAGLGSAVGEMSSKAKAGVGIVASVAGAVGVMFNEAVDAEGATQRFNSTLGNMADEVENLRSIQGLDTDLSKLALTLGSDDDKVRNVSSRLFELATASGKSRQDASLYTQQMVALGARAVALNPQLGDLGDVTDALSTALVRGGRFAAKYGLDLSADEINARALITTHKESVDQLTFVEKAMAGAAIASEKYGDNLDKVIARGAKNAVTEQRRLGQTVRENLEELGKPLIAPIFEVMGRAIPVVREVGRSVATLAQAALPPLVAILRVAEPILRFVADALEHIPGPLLAAAAAILLFQGRAQGSWAWLKALGGEALSTGDKLGRIAGGAAIAYQGFQQIGKGTTESAVGIGSMVAGGAVLGSAFGPWGAAAGGFAGAIVGVGKALFGGGESADDMRERLANLAYEMTAMTRQQALRAFIKSVGDDFYQMNFSTGRLTVNFQKVRQELVQVGQTSPAAARRVLEGMQSLVAQGVLTQRQFDQLTAAVQRQSTAYGEAARRKQEAAAADKQLVDGATAQIAAQEAAKQAWDNYVQALAAGAPTVTSVFDAAASSIDNFSEAAAPEKLLENLQKQAEGIANFQSNVQFLMDQGLTELAAVVAQKGPIAGAELAQALRGASPEVLAGMNAALGTASGAIDAWNAYVQNVLAPQLSGTGFAAGYNVSAGMAGGIYAGAGQAYAAADQVAAGVKGRIASSLVVMSPSRVMIKMGEQIGAGLAIGIRSSREMVLREATETGQAASAGVQIGSLSIPVTVPQPTSWHDLGAAARYGAAAGDAAAVALRTRILGAGRRS